MSRKMSGAMVIAFAAIAAMMFAGAYPTNAVAEDEKKAEDAAKPTGEEKAQPAKPDEAKPADNPVAKPAENASKPEQKPEAILSALPTCEAPLWPESPIWVHYPEIISSHTYASIDVIEDGKQSRKYIYGDPEQTVHFVVRTDGWTHASAQFFNRERDTDCKFASAIVLVPNEQAKTLWETWFAEKCAEGKKEQLQRVYPSNVLPPK